MCISPSEITELDFILQHHLITTAALLCSLVLILLLWFYFLHNKGHQTACADIIRLS